MPHVHSRLVVVITALGIFLSACTAGQVKNYVPVTNTMLENPDPSDWLNWRRTLDAWGFSPLKQIDRHNVAHLQLVWSSGLAAGGYEGSPLVHSGVIYIINPGKGDIIGGVQARDAATGGLIWEYTRPNNGVAPSGREMRSIAIFEDKIFYATADAHIVALDARRGNVVWDQMVADYRLGYRYSSGPIVAKGNVIAGITGCDRFKVAGVSDVCFISAHNPQTGKELWRMSTVARPGEPGGDTWGTLPLMFRAGGDAWISGSFDPNLNTIYWSTAQPKPLARISRRTDGAALYTSSVLALEPETGKLKWYHQLVPGETFDQDEVFESLLIDRDNRTSLFKMGKLGILWELDRTTGEFVAARDLGYQNQLDVNPRTGEVAYRPGMIPKPGVEITHCPDFLGVKNWRAMSYHPETEALYIPININCQKTVFTEVELVEGGGANSADPFPGEKTIQMLPNPIDPEHRGGFIVILIKTGKIVWKHMFRTGVTSSALTTAGGLAFVGDADGYFYAYDAGTGEVLYRVQLPGVATGSPITYLAHGRQFVAVPVAARRNGGNAILVFALPDRSSVANQ